MSKERTTQVRITTAAAKTLREQAAVLGYVLKRGPMTGYGDTATMLEMIAAGELCIERVVTYRKREDDEAE